MIKLLCRFILVVILLDILSCTPARDTHIKPSNPFEELNNEIDYLLSDPNLQNAQIGLYIESLSDQKILYKMNEYKLFIPASNMKLFTTAAAFAILGDDFRFKTSVKTNGKISNDTLYGDLIIYGGGDPTFSGRFYDNCTLCAFSAWADSLQMRGIKVIKGDVIADDSFFNGAALGEGWDWDDLPFWYAAESSALSLNDNCVDITIFAADSLGLPVKVKTDPKVAGIEIVNNSVTVASDSISTLKITRDLGQNKIIISGQFPLSNHTIRRSVTVHNPTSFFINAVKTVLENNDISILRIKQETLPDSAKSLFNIYSPSLSQIVKVVNKRSQNFYAEQLLKTMGAYLYNEGSFESGVKAVSKWGNTVGIDNNSFIMVDGSGLSRKNFITPKAVARLLEYMSIQHYFLQFYNTLPVSAVDGTLKNRMAGTPAANNVHAKTGTMSHVKNLSGYLRGKDGKLYLFVILANNFSVPSSYISNLQDHICVLLYNYSTSIAD